MNERWACWNRGVATSLSSIVLMLRARALFEHGESGKDGGVVDRTASVLARTLDSFGYAESLCASKVSVPDGAGTLEFVAYCQEAPWDFRTSAFACGVASDRSPEGYLLDLARQVAAPFALIAAGPDVVLFRVGATGGSDLRLASFDGSAGVPSSEMVRALSPSAIRDAKLGSRQLPLFPLDVRLLETARTRSVETLTGRVHDAYLGVHEHSRLKPGDAARLVVHALAAVIVRDKYRLPAAEPAQLIDAVMARHGAYFESLALHEAESPHVVAAILDQLSDGIDYSAIDARTINKVYENLLVTPEIRAELGIFYTPPEFATRLLDSLPIEAIAPGERRVFDPACGSGNLLLAAIERLELLMPGGWSPSEAHAWLKTHVSGSDVDPIATEIARLSMLVSSLPLGNNWEIETRDVLEDPPRIEPTIIVSNPPWRNLRGKRAEAATDFLNRSIEMLAPGGLLACVLPASWLSTTTARQGRKRLADGCEVFEVWRLPRDLFEEARYSSAVVFCRKVAEGPKRERHAFRWVAPGAEHRKAFLEHASVTFSWLAPTPPPGDSLMSGPLDVSEQTAVRSLRDVADVVSGVVQKGDVQTAPGGKYLALARGTGYESYSTTRAMPAIRIASASDLGVGGRDLRPFKAPQILVQAHRNPDTAWRLRPVLDLRGLVPSNSWHAVISKSENDAGTFALFALLASSVASIWIHSHVATKNIPKTALNDLPLPPDWQGVEGKLNQLGHRLVSTDDKSTVLGEIEEVVVAAYGLTDRQLNDIHAIMGNSVAPEGSSRLTTESSRHATSNDAPFGSAEARPGAVLQASGAELRIWALGGPEKGQRMELPEHFPGWLAMEGAVFDVVGPELSEAQYRFHRASHRSEVEMFGLEQ